MLLIDSHCHFDDDSFDADRTHVYERARAVGVVGQILPAVGAGSWQKLKLVAAAYPGLYPAYGLHPMLLAEHRPEHLLELERWIEREGPVAVGECGLDYFMPELDPEQQAYYFAAQLKLARHHDLPVIVHARRSVDHVIKYIRRFPGVRGVVHSFSGSEQQARRLLDLGFRLSFGGPLGYSRARRLRDLIKRLPLEGFLLETDAPFQPGPNHRGKRNEPAFVTETLAIIAELRDQDPAEIAAVTLQSTVDLFRLEQCPTPSLAPQS